MKKYFFLAGLPRSGSTLLSCILNQNPDIYCSPDESLICDLIYRTDVYIENSHEYKSCTNKVAKHNVCKSIIENFYQDKNQQYVIDKCRSWGTPYNLNLIKTYITEDIKIICPVRPILEVLSSFINLFHTSDSDYIFVDNNIQNNGRFIYRQIDDLRCDELMSMNGPIDQALFSLSQSKLDENKKYFHLIEYDNLVYDTKKTIKNIYDFLEIKYFDHSFDNIKSSNELNHHYYGIPDLHKVRSKVEKIYKDPKNILSDYVIQKYGQNYEVWK